MTSSETKPWQGTPGCRAVISRRSRAGGRLEDDGFRMGQEQNCLLEKVPARQAEHGRFCAGL